MTNKASDWFDISAPIINGMVNWPGDPEILVSKHEITDNGVQINVTHLSLLAHTSTHLDAPKHYFTEGKDVSQIPMDDLIGKAIILEINGKSISRQILESVNIPEHSRILFKTLNSEDKWYYKQFKSEFVGLTIEAAKYLQERKIICVGIDYISIAEEKNSNEIHKILLGAGIFIIEGLYMKDIQAGKFWEQMVHRRGW